MTASVVDPQLPPEAGPPSPNVIELDALKKWFDIGRGLFRGSIPLKAVDGVTLAIARGETLAVVGESGSGKTTLGRTVIRLLEPTDGRLLYDGQDITHQSEKELMWLRRKAQMIPQDPYSSVNPAFPVYRILEEPLVIHKEGDRAQRGEAVMKARRLLEGATFEPETLQAVYRAFDEAWLEIANHFAGDEIEAEQARLRLAHAVLVVAGQDGNDADQLKNDALRIMALGYRKRD